MNTVRNQENIATIHFSTKLFKINSWTILLLPENESKKLPARSMVMVEGTLNGHAFKDVLEPDGRGSHWFRVESSLQKEAHIKAGDTVQIEISPSKNWINPEMPPDMKKALVGNETIYELWNDITPMARWDWVRWVRAVKSEETRKKHVDVMISKLSHGMRRPCCFNRNLCSEPAVSRNWVLMDPMQ